MALMRPMHTTIMYGNPSQVLTMRIITFARKGSENHPGRMPNRAFRIRLISPMLLLNSPLNTRMEMKPGTA